MMDILPVSGTALQFPAFHSNHGGMSERIRNFNWSETPLGAVNYWKHSLRSVLSICLNSNFPIAIYWGKDLRLLYNDAWSPIPGNKHPWALGRPAREVWPEIWDAIEPQFAKAFSGQPGGSKDALLPMLRHGYTEECYFDFTFTPVFGEDGQVEGIFNAVVETTYQLIHERRTGFLQKLSQKLSAAPSVADVFKKVNTFIKNNSADISFCFIYTLSDGQEPVLVSSTSTITPAKKLPFHDLIKNGSTKHIQTLHHYLDKIPDGYWPEHPSEALLVPLKANNGLITGFIFAGLSARRRYDREYQLFVEGVATVISTALNMIQTLEEERKRAEATDIARMKLEKSEAALRLANDQLELTFRNVPAAIYLFNKEGKILFVNSQAQLSIAISSLPENLQELDIQWFHKKTSELFELHDESGSIFSMENTPAMNTFRSGKASQQIIHFTSKLNGDQKWILASASPLLNEAGELMMVLASSTDITFQKRAEEKIRESEENFRSLTQALPQLVWVTDAQGRQEYVTERWKEYTGLDPRDMKTWAIIIHPDDSRSLASIWTSCIVNGNTYKAEARLKGKNGEYRWFYVHGEPICNEKKETIQWVGAFTDIHEQKMAEELLRQSEEKLEFLVKKRTEELERSNEDLQQFAHVASHDLKEPIRKIKIFSDMLEEEINPQINDKAKLYLSKVQSAADRMLLMMEGVLRYAGLDGYEQEIEKINVNEIIESVETDLETVIQRRKAKIECDSLPVIPGYSILIYQLFYNLLSNALKFSRTDIAPHIQILYSKQIIGNRLFAQFVIKDNGIGFEPENSEKIFNSFSRLNSREDYEGTGLGLTLCKKIVSRHQGFLTAHGEPGLGAEFTVQLPLTHTI
jgi:PAS domain S-box-containing protein